MAQDRSYQTIDNHEVETESDIELVEVDAASCSATFNSQTSTSHPNSVRSTAPPDENTETSPAADVDATAAPDRTARSAGNDELAEAAEPSASTATSVCCDSSACEQDRLLKELIGKLAEQGGSTHEESPPEADADSDYVRIEPHEANECHMTWSGSSVSSRFSFLVPRTQSDEDLASQPSDLGDLCDEPAPSGLQDVDDREESDQALSVVTLGAPVDGVRLAGGGLVGPALLQQPFQPRGLWLRDGDDAPRAALVDVDVATDPLVRHYKHSKNSDVNHVLNVVAVAALVLAVGIGIGHCIGSAREASLQRQIRDDQDSKLRELREDLLMCLRKQEDISQTITKLNEIEAILIDAEHWRNEYEELLKLKVQAEDGWRLERASILDQLAQNKAELSRVATCHRDSELLSRQQVELDDVHAKLQAALDHKQKQAVDQQEQSIASPPLDCREKLGLGGFVSQMTAEQLSPPASTCSTSRRPSADCWWTAAEDFAPDEAQLRGCARLVLAARERRLATAEVRAKASSPAAAAGAAVNGCGSSRSLGQMALDRSLRLYTVSSGKSGGNVDSRSIGGADHSDEAASSRKKIDDATAVVRDEKAETAVQRTLSTLLNVAEHTLSAAKHVANSSLHVLSKAANTSLHILSKAANRSLHTLSRAANRSLHFQSKFANSSYNITDSSKDALVSAINGSMNVLANVADRWFNVLFKAANGSMDVLSRVANSSANAAFKFVNSSFDVVSKIADRSLNALSKVANSSLAGQSNDSAALREPKDRPSAAAAAAEQVNMAKVREAAAFVRTGAHLFGKAVQQALRSVANAVTELRSFTAATRPSAPATSKEPVTDGAGDKDESVVDRSPSMPVDAAATVASSDAFATTIDESQFWAEFKELRQLVNNFTKRAGVAGESDRTYKALMAFVQRYSDSRNSRGMPPGVEWRAWCDCQLAWWTGHLKKLDVGRGTSCSERLAEWQVDALETGAASGTSAPNVALDVATAEKSDDRRDPGWFFERAAEREFVRDTPDDWYWRKMKEAYVQVHKLFTDGQPRH